MFTKMNGWHAFCGAVLMAALTGSPAVASTVAFEFKNGATTVATGLFSYSSANAILSYTDLDSFSLTIGTSTFDLGFVTDPSRSLNTYFQYDTAAGDFVHAPVPAMYGLDTEIASMSNNYGDGFIFTFGANQYFTYDGGPTSDKFHQPWTDVVVTDRSTEGTVPEPASLLLVGSGLAGLAMKRRRKRSA